MSYSKFDREVLEEARRDRLEAEREAERGAVAADLTDARERLEIEMQNERALKLANERADEYWRTHEPGGAPKDAA